MNNFHKIQNFRQISDLFSQIWLKKRHTSLFSGILREIRKKKHQKFAEKMQNSIFFSDWINEYSLIQSRKSFGDFWRKKLWGILNWIFPEVWGENSIQYSLHSLLGCAGRESGRGRSFRDPFGGPRAMVAHFGKLASVGKVDCRDCPTGKLYSLLKPQVLVRQRDNFSGNVSAEPVLLCLSTPGTGVVP